MNHLATSLRELRFLLWEFLPTESELLSVPPYGGRDRAYYDDVLEKARGFALEMGEAYRASDIEECHLRDDGTVALPTDFERLWSRWSAWAELGAAATGRAEANGDAVMPAPVKQAIMELLMGANPAFMCFGGFTAPAARLIRLHGTPQQKALLLEPLESFHWDACYCATENEAGSDLLAIRTEAEEVGPSLWSLTGDKRYITAGRHDLTDNTVYVVLARLKDAPANSMFLSCFLVPRYWIDTDTGERSDNHVECIGVPRKMGLRGCPNTHLTFGRKGQTRAFLLGDRRNAGLLQFVSLARQARVNSGIFAVGLASTAYLNSVRYARGRVQGRRLSQVSSADAARVPIIEHADVQRMLIDMKARVEACRGLIGKVSLLSARLTRAEHRDQPDADEIAAGRKLVELLVPIVKTYCSEQGWRVCEAAIQLHGGIGYTDSVPVEQYARDARIMSIWEGTTYVQALLLVRDALAFGRNASLMDRLEGMMRDSFAERPLAPSVAPRADELWNAFGECRAAMNGVHRALQERRLDPASFHFTRIAEMFGTTLAAWCLLEAASVAEHAAARTTDAQEHAFYRGKTKAMHYFFDLVLPEVEHARHLVEKTVADDIALQSAEFALID
ncbi:acyl-CoA dehydrogenase [Tahibacter amnicola]|uniref:Acyl-CoA dehydrogenase n=1 Tax=Tahibacter amnicola TaxID=2976241 RepID=A0ABY6B8J1_9GAMM|nr:acyl-CoA dehydrogenase [Tahibacter amnicola]UXI66194.1 acyl-CoA dehydrogenase [Tahibacter amnicola]